MNKILRIQYDARSLADAFFHGDRWINRTQLIALFDEFHMRLVSSMGLPPIPGNLSKSYAHGLDFVPTDSVIVQGDPKNLDLLLIKAAPIRVYLTWEEIELPESLKQLYNLNINTQENCPMSTSKPTRVLIPYFTASGKQYWYDTKTGQVGVGDKPHATNKSTYLFAAKADVAGNVTRSKNRYSVHISTIRAIAKQKQALTTEKSVGSWPQPASSKGEVKDSCIATSIATAHQNSARPDLENKIDSLTAKVAQLTNTVTVLTDRLASFDGFIRK